MASLDLSLTVETDLVWDAINTAMIVVERLRSRHGDRFRVLERRFEAFAFQPEPWAAGEHAEIEPGRFVLAPPPELMSLISEARRLGVINGG